MFVPFATSIVLVMGTPDAEPAQPRALVGGHLISTLVGLADAEHHRRRRRGRRRWRSGSRWRSCTLTRTFHPPAGIDPLIVVAQDMPWSFLVAPVAAGALALLAFAWLWHRLVRRDAWPARW